MRNILKWHARCCGDMSVFWAECPQPSKLSLDHQNAQSFCYRDCTFQKEKILPARERVDRREAVLQIIPPSEFCLISYLYDWHISLDIYSYDESSGLFEGWFASIRGLLLCSRPMQWPLMWSSMSDREQTTGVGPYTHTPSLWEHRALSVRTTWVGQMGSWGLGLHNLSLKTSNTKYHLSSQCLLYTRWSFYNISNFHNKPIR